MTGRIEKILKHSVNVMLGYIPESISFKVAATVAGTALGSLRSHFLCHKVISASRLKGGVTRCNFPCSKSRNAVARHAARSLLLHEPRCYTVQHSSCSLQRFEFLEEKRLGQLACATRILARAWREI